MLKLRTHDVHAAVGAFISAWSLRMDTRTSGGQTSVFIGLLGATCSNGQTLATVTRAPSSAATGSFTNGSLMTDASESSSGYTSLEVT